MNTLILLHGRGATAESIKPLAREFADASYQIITPQGPYNNSWYPYSFMEKESLNEPYVTHSVAIVKKLIDQFPPENTVIMGFSQGACLALETAARFPAYYKGVVAFTGGLIGSTLNLEKYKGDFKGAPIFIGNSDLDPHVPLIRSEESKSLLEQMGAQVTLKVYPNMPHTINSDEIDWVRKNIFNK